MKMRTWQATAADTALVLLSALLFWLVAAHLLLAFAWVFLAPLALALRRSWEGGRRGGGALMCILFAVLVNATSLWWLARWGVHVLVLSTAAMAAAAGANFHAGRLARFGALEVLAPPLLWIASIPLLDLTPLGGACANIAFFHPLAAPLAGVIGSLGMTWLMVQANWTLALAAFYRSRRLAAASALLLLVPAATSLYSLGAAAGGREVTVALVQGNFPQPWQWRMDNLPVILDRYEGLTRGVADERPDFVIWPEYALPADFFRDRGLHDRVSAFAREIGAVLVTGTMTYADGRNTGYEDRRTDTVVVFSPGGGLVARYDSARPLPVDRMTVPGVSSPVVRTAKGSFAVAICFEEYAGSPAFAEDVDFLVAVANNNKFDRSPGIGLASLFSRLRAVEAGRYLLRATNTGVTQVVDPFGKVVGRLEPGSQGVLVARIRI